MNSGELPKTQRYELTERGRVALLDADQVGAVTFQLLEQDLATLERAEALLGPLTRPGRPIPHQVRSELLAASTALANAIAGVSYHLEHPRRGAPGRGGRGAQGAPVSRAAAAPGPVTLRKARELGAAAADFRELVRQAQEDERGLGTYKVRLKKRAEALHDAAWELQHDAHRSEENDAFGRIVYGDPLTLHAYGVAAFSRAQAIELAAAFGWGGS